MVLAVVLMFRLSPALELLGADPRSRSWPSRCATSASSSTRLYETIQAALATLSAKAQENLAGVRVIRAYAQEDAEMRGFDAPNREYVTRNLKLIGAWSMFMPALTALIGLTFVLVLWFGGREVISGQISLGEFVAFYAYMVQLVFPMIALGFVTNIFQRGAASMGRLNYILDAQPSHPRCTPPRPRAGARPAAKPPFSGEIEFRHLNFSYPTTRSGAGPGANGTRSPRHAGPARHQPARSSGLDAGDRRPDRQRQEHARGAGRAPVGGASRTRC